MTNEKRIEEIKSTLAIYYRNYTCLEMCDVEKMKDLEIELEQLQSPGWTDAEIHAQEMELLATGGQFEGSTEDYNRTIQEHDL